MPDEGFRCRQIHGFGRRRCQAFQRLGDAGSQVDQALVHEWVPDNLTGEGPESMVPPELQATQEPCRCSISPSYAQDISGMFGSATQFLPLVLIFVVFYFLLIRPQQQKQKEMRSMLSALKRGDRVVTGGGIIGTVQRVPMTTDKDGKQVTSNEIEVEIAPNIRVTVLRETISSVVRPTAANDAKPVKEKAS